MLFLTTIFLCLFSLPWARGLQATSNSACASLCIDSLSNNSSNPSAFNTYEKSLTCSDSKYSSTDAGEKFEKCNACLLNSTAEEDGVTDQEALMYNLRATVDHCLWGFPNASSVISSPCVINYSCEPLKNALTYDNLSTTNNDVWGYCSADGGAFLGENLAPCVECFQATTDETYIANFLIALEAGCMQRPGPGQAIGLEGSLFSTTAVNITTPISTTVPKPQSNGMKIGTVVGIAVGGVLSLVGVIAFGIVYFRKRRTHQKDMLQLKSDCDTRYGAEDISAPTIGGFAQVPSPRGMDGMPDYERRAQKLYGNGDAGDRLSGEPAIPRNLYTAAWLVTPSRSDTMPAHPAYINGEAVKLPPPPPRVELQQAKPAVLSPRRDNIGLAFPANTKTKKTTFEPGLDYESNFMYEMRSPSIAGSRMGLLSPGLPATPKAGLFKFRNIGKSGRSGQPMMPPKTPHDIWN